MRFRYAGSNGFGTHTRHGIVQFAGIQICLIRNSSAVAPNPCSGFLCIDYGFARYDPRHFYLGAGREHGACSARGKVPNLLSEQLRHGESNHSLQSAHGYVQTVDLNQIGRRSDPGLSGSRVSLCFPLCIPSSHPLLPCRLLTMYSKGQTCRRYYYSQHAELSRSWTGKDAKYYLRDS